MSIKLVSIFLSLSLFLSSAECGSEQFKRSQKRTISKKAKIILTTALVVAAATGTAVAVANLAPEQYPEMLRPYMPSFLLCESAQQVFNETKSSDALKKRKKTNTPSNNPDGETQNHDLCTNWEAIESGINNLKQQINGDNLSEENKIKNFNIIQKIDSDLSYTISYKKSLDDKPESANFASSLSRHIKGVLKNYNELCRQVPSLQQSNETQEIFAEMKKFAQALDNKFGKAENYWLENPPFTK